MKRTIIVFLTLAIWVSQCQSQADPDKICYDYDKAGNRIAQNSAWLNPGGGHPDYLPDCTPNNPDEYIKNTWRVYIVRILNVDDQLPYLVDRIGRPVPLVTTVESADLVTKVNATFIDINDPILTNTNHNIFVYGELSPLLPPLPPPPSLARNQTSESPQLSIVPNPNLGHFKLEQTGFDIASSVIFIYDNNGRILFQRSYDTGEVSIGEFSSGKYILVLKDKVQQKSIRFEKLK